MRKTKKYEFARFSPEVLQEAAQTLWPAKVARRRWFMPASDPDPPFTGTLMVESDGVRWEYEDEKEFFDGYRGSSGEAYYWRRSSKSSLDVSVSSYFTQIEISAPDRATIESVFSVFETKLGESLVPSPPAPKPSVFIGHGQAPDWRDLKDHLHDQHES